MKSSVIILLICAIYTAAFAQPCPELRLKEGKKEYNKGNYQTAKEIFERGLNCIGGISETSKTELQKFINLCGINLQITKYTLLYSSINCKEGDSILFEYGEYKSAALPENVKKILKEFCNKISQSACANFRVKIVVSGSSDERSPQHEWDIVNSFIDYIKEKYGILETRIIFTYGSDLEFNGAFINGVCLKLITEKVPDTIPVPHPNLKKNK